MFVLLLSAFNEKYIRLRCAASTRLSLYVAASGRKSTLSFAMGLSLSSRPQKPSATGPWSPFSLPPKSEYENLMFVLCLTSYEDIYHRAALQAPVVFIRLRKSQFSVQNARRICRWASFSLLVLKTHGQRGNDSPFVYLQNLQN
jgi:hypothetical protein